MNRHMYIGIALVIAVVGEAMANFTMQNKTNDKITAKVDYHEGVGKSEKHEFAYFDIKPGGSLIIRTSGFGYLNIHGPTGQTVWGTPGKVSATQAKDIAQMIVELDKVTVKYKQGKDQEFAIAAYRWQ